MVSGQQPANLESRTASLVSGVLPDSDQDAIPFLGGGLYNRRPLLGVFAPPFRWCDAASVVLGAFISIFLVFHCRVRDSRCRHVSIGPSSHDRPQPVIIDGPGMWHGTSPDSMPTGLVYSDRVAASAGVVRQSPHAYVQVAFDPPGNPPRQLLRAFATARALQRTSKYPLLLLTNSSLWSDAQERSRKLALLNVHVYLLRDVPIPARAEKAMSEAERQAFLKLQIFLLTDFQKLIFLDTDGILTRSVDWLFERSPVWGQRDTATCSAPQFQWGVDAGKLSSGILLIEPNTDTYDRLMHYARTTSIDWWNRGPEGLLQDYFEYVARWPVQLLDLSAAASGSCLRKLPGLSEEARGPWAMPAFVQKSSAHNECFDFDIAAQRRIIDGEPFNVCQYNPLAAWWRSLFCSAANITQVTAHGAGAYCDDNQWYKVSYDLVP